jgi:hypothetical protein
MLVTFVANLKSAENSEFLSLPTIDFLKCRFTIVWNFDAKICAHKMAKKSKNAYDKILFSND